MALWQNPQDLENFGSTFLLTTYESSVYFIWFQLDT